jgi:hypothetical protein
MNMESRKVRIGGRTRILPPETRGDLWHGSSHEDSWEQTRQLVEWQRVFGEQIAEPVSS